MSFILVPRRSKKFGPVSVVPISDDIIPADRITVFQPGVTVNGGIPNRTTIFTTLSPIGGTSDDTAQIQSALDNCPANQVINLNAGTFNINGGGLQYRASNTTLRGVGPGTGSGGGTGTRLIKADRLTNPDFGILWVGREHDQFSASINLASNAVKGANSLTLVSNPGIQVGEFVLVDMVTTNHSDVFWGPSHDPPGGVSRSWFARLNRSLSQMMEVTAVNGNTITFATPFHITFETAFTAQLARFTQSVTRGIGIEGIYFYGGMGGQGNLSMTLCVYSWIKNVESHFAIGPSINMSGTYRSELRDSYMHETPDPNPGGGGYLFALNNGAAENLIENNIMWYGNKVVVMRATGGGNVFAYNYTDDAFGGNYPSLPEAGLNAGHYTTPHMELLEGNYTHNYKGDDYWGNSIYITVFRNHLSAIRAAHPPLDTYMSGNQPYMDLGGRTAVDVQAYSYYTNFVGNVLGKQGQTLLHYHVGGWDADQNSWLYENLANFPAGDVVTMWTMGEDQSHQSVNGNSVWVATTYQTQLREGNWDWYTQTQKWHGIGGVAGSSSPKQIRNSLYLSDKPAFFGSNTWPWVDPSTGTTYTLPAKARFDAGTPNLIA